MCTNGVTDHSEQNSGSNLTDNVRFKLCKDENSESCPFLIERMTSDCHFILGDKSL